ncbi:SCP-like protein [Aphelenchoides besseyi]|nr:SCP-like protein [Aphelenchoides besseyi]KAI6236017.1 SCP-like protein [Aphelenchoides besseyi]
MLVYGLFLSSLLLVVFCDNLDSNGKRTCLNEHNRYRSDLANGKVQNGNGQRMPKAANMNEMKYGKDLEAKAQDWAKRCPGMKHTPNPTYGQNLYWTSESVDHSTALRQATKAWWDEVRLLKGTSVMLTASLFNQGVGHWTQMAQAKNTKVGCAVQRCSGTYVVCNYDRQNMLNEPIYQKGTKCSKCNGGRKCTSNGLCSSSSMKRHRRS